MCKAPVKSLPPTNQHQTFYRPGALPVAQPRVSKHQRGNSIYIRQAKKKNNLYKQEYFILKQHNSVTAHLSITVSLADFV